MLHVTTADRADHLVARLAGVLVEPLTDPFATEVVAVHSRGIERWLAQRLSTVLGARPGRRDGVAATIDFPFPHRLARSAVAAALGTDPDDDPWHRDRLAWRIVGTLTPPGAPPRCFGPLSGRADPRRLGAARHVAGLLGRYLAHRPEMLATWLDDDGDDLDAGGRALPERHAWQADLVRALVADGLSDPTADHARAVARLAAGDVALDLPPRLTVFGITALPVRQLAVLEAIAAHRDVHLLVLHPSPALWSAVAASRDDDGYRAPRRSTATVPVAAVAWPTMRHQDPTAGLARNPLLASWGRDARELQLALPPAPWSPPGAGDLDRLPDEHRPDEHRPDEHRSLLQRLQDDVRGDRALALTADDVELPALAWHDRSVELHDVHGELRQVEVLREVLLHALDAPPAHGRPALEPRDVIVMCPDVERFAPLVRAVFGEATALDRTTLNPSAPGPTAIGRVSPNPVSPNPVDGTSDPTRQLRVRLADRALREVNPLLTVGLELLTLSTARRTSVEVLSLLASSPVARRFELDDDLLGRLGQWVAAVQVRWGLDADDRVAAGLPPIAAHTFAHGLDRMALGLAMADEDLRSVDGVVPFGDVEGDDADVVGRLAEFLERLGTALDRLATPQTMAAWCAAIADGVDALALAPPDADWQRQQLHRVLDDLGAEAAGPGAGTPLAIDEVRSLLRARLTGAPTRSGHRSGAITFSTLVPMRSVPHRLVVLLGLDDGRFPRRVVHDADDLLHRQPAVGDREVRAEDRQLLLDALLAAGERLVVVHAGRDVRTNAELPPAVPVTELREAIDRTVRAPAGAVPAGAVPSEAVPQVLASQHLTVRHHLHAHHPAAFTDGGVGALEGPWGYDAPLLAAARATVARQPVARRPAARQAAGRALVTDDLSPWPREDVIILDDLVAFLVHPVRHFLRTRLELSLVPDRDELATEMPTELRGLDRWRVGDALLTAWRDAEEPDDAMRVVRGRGLLPVGVDVDGVAADVAGVVADVVGLAEASGLEPGDRRSVDVDAELPDGRRVVGVVPHVHAWTLDAVGFGRVRATHRLSAWARWLALLAGTPQDHWTAVVAGARQRRDAWQVERHTLGADRLLRVSEAPEARTAAGRALERLVDLRDRGLDAPPPLYAETSAGLALKLRNGWSLDRSWDWTTGRRGYRNEDRDPHHVLVHGGVLSFADLLATDPVGDEAGWAAAEHGRVAAWAVRLWGPVEAVERWARA